MPSSVQVAHPSASPSHTACVTDLPHPPPPLREGGRALSHISSSRPVACRQLACSHHYPKGRSWQAALINTNTARCRRLPYRLVQLCLCFQARRHGSWVMGHEPRCHMPMASRPMPTAHDPRQVGQRVSMEVGRSPPAYLHAGPPAQVGCGGPPRA